MVLVYLLFLCLCGYANYLVGRELAIKNELSYSTWAIAIFGLILPIGAAFYTSFLIFALILILLVITLGVIFGWRSTL